MTVGTQAHADDQQFEAVYDQYFDLLVDIAEFKFRVPGTDAESLAHDVLISYLRKSASVVDLRRWLIGAICYASRHYWRLNDRTRSAELDAEFDRVDPASLYILDSLPNQLAAREALECLSPRYRSILQMRYFEGCTIAEVATRLGVKTKYAQKLITKCLRRAEQLYTRKEQEKGRRK
ncbi:MAG TPA: sigma-70 family RNA polymerase sigma factor [Thermoanaerobaculia bacterium]|nr:sigma-70 family RNA polymerase sigma factor [Thermoanaerobaculia bacterium]